MQNHKTWRAQSSAAPVGLFSLRSYSDWRFQHLLASGLVHGEGEQQKAFDQSPSHCFVFFFGILSQVVSNINSVQTQRTRFTRLFETFPSFVQSPSQVVMHIYSNDSCPPLPRVFFANPKNQGCSSSHIVRSR